MVRAIDFGPAGMITHIMNVEEIAKAMVEMAQKKEMRLAMGEKRLSSCNGKI